LDTHTLLCKSQSKRNDPDGSVCSQARVPADFDEIDAAEIERMSAGDWPSHFG
jgi:hypothetical protein